MAEYFKEPYPARSTIGVASLPRDAQVEIDAIVGSIEAARAAHAQVSRARPRPQPTTSARSVATLPGVGPALLEMLEPRSVTLQDSGSICRCATRIARE